MQQNLKLEIFRISLKKRGGSNSDLINFKDFFEKTYSKSSKHDNYNEFITDYISSFNSSFALNKDKTKGIATKKQHSFVHRSTKNIIDGEVIGGNTGLLQDLYKQDNSAELTGKVDDDTVSTLPYYLKLWTPFDHNTGILMVHSYSNLTVTDLVKVHLTKLFQKHDYTLLITSHVPNSLKEEFKKKSSVYKVAFVKESLSKGKRRLLNPMFTEFDNLKVRIEISGFKEEVGDFWKKLTKNAKITNANLKDFEINDNNDFKTIAYYKDQDGHHSNASIQKNFEIQPTIFLDDKLKKKDSPFLDFEKVKNHTDFILDEIKKEINYTGV